MENLRLKWNHIRWKKGSSELIGFALILPAIAVILFSVITVFQICLARQSLEHATYMAGRAAVVCDTYNAAVEQARMTARSSLVESTFHINQDDIRVSLELVGGTSSPTEGSRITWEKGALVKCTVSFPVNGVVALLGRDVTMDSCIYLMVERPARTYY